LRFRRLIESGDFTGAVQVALDQVRGGANLLDVNMDADLLDSAASSRAARPRRAARPASAASSRSRSAPTRALS